MNPDQDGPAFRPPTPDTTPNNGAPQTQFNPPANQQPSPQGVQIQNQNQAAPPVMQIQPEASPQTRKSLRKKVTIIGAVLGGLILLGVGVWALTGSILAAPLTEYDEGEYSIGIPEGYEKQPSRYTDEYVAEMRAAVQEKINESDGLISGDRFSEFSEERIAEMRQDENRRWLGGNGENEKSAIVVSKNSFFGTVEEEIEETKQEGTESDSIKNITFNEERIQSYDSLVVTFDALENGELYSRNKYAYIFVNEDTYYSVWVSERVEDEGTLIKFSDQIIKSFKLN